jgi:hypothetical protein
MGTGSGGVQWLEGHRNMEREHGSESGDNL